jgi:hypothetical protein
MKDFFLETPVCGNLVVVVVAVRRKGLHIP